MKLRSLLVAVTLMTLVGLLLAACAPQATPAATEPAASGGGAAAAYAGDYYLVPKNLGNPYFDTANNGAQEAAKELGINVKYQGSATADATEQITLLNHL